MKTSPHLLLVPLLGTLIALGSCNDTTKSSAEPPDGRERISDFAEAVSKNDMAELHRMLCASMVRGSVKTILDDLGPDGRKLFQDAILSAPFDPAQSSQATSVYTFLDSGEPPHRMILRQENGYPCVEML